MVRRNLRTIRQLLQFRVDFARLLFDDQEGLNPIPSQWNHQGLDLLGVEFVEASAKHRVTRHASSLMTEGMLTSHLPGGKRKVARV
jgi:hypothetical protein